MSSMEAAAATVIARVLLLLKCAAALSKMEKENLPQQILARI